MKSTKTIMEEGISSAKLSILVFGPQVRSLSGDVRMRALQNKRIEIRDELEKLGHYVKYAEDVVDPKLSAPLNNIMLQEIAIMNEYDMIIALVESPGSIAEAACLSLKPNLAQKATLFLDSSFNNGLVAETCRLAEIGGARFETYTYPDDLTKCNLMGFVKTRVADVQTLKYLS